MSSSIFPHHRPMTRARYERILSELRGRFPWAAQHSLTVAPGHLDALAHMLTRLEEIFAPATLQAMDFLRVSTGAGSLSVNLNVGLDDQARRLALFSAIDECKKLAARCCMVCAAPHNVLNEGRCERHQGTSALYAEAFRQRKRKPNGAPPAEDLFPGTTARQPFCAAESPSTAERQAETTVPPSIGFLDPAAFTAFCNGIGSRPRDHQARYEVVRNKVRLAGFARRKLGVLPLSWLTLVDEFEAAFPNFGEYAEVLRDHFALSTRGDHRICLPPTLFVGPPGIGKSEAMSWLAERLALPFELFDMASAQSGAALNGSDAFWSNTQPGRLFELLAYQELANPLVMLDELDKISNDERYNPMAGLYSLLEQRSARKFVDLSIRDFAIDASHVNWIATANALDNIPTPILSRFTVMQIPAPNSQQLRQIAQNLYKRLRSESPWGASFAEGLDEKVAKSLVEQSPRSMRIALQRAFGAAAREGRNKIALEDLPVTRSSRPRGIGFLATFDERELQTSQQMTKKIHSHP